MSRESQITMAAVVVIFVLAIGYFAAYEPATGFSTACREKFDRLDSVQDDNKLEPREFMSYNPGVELSMEHFARVDSDKNEIISDQEFCSFIGAEEKKG